MSDYTLQVDIRANASSANKEIKGVNNGLNSIKSSAKSVKSSLSGAFNTSILKGWKVSADKNIVSLERFDKGMKSLKSSSAQAATATKKVTDNIKQTSTATSSTALSASELQQAFRGLESVSWLNLLMNNLGAANKHLKKLKLNLGAIGKHGEALEKHLKNNGASDFYAGLAAQLDKDGIKLHGLKAAFKALKESVKAVGVSLGPVAAALAVIATIVTTIKNAINVAKLGDDVDDLSKKLNISKVACQEWGYVLEQNGLAVEDLQVPLRQLNKHLTSGDGVLAKYGVTATNTEGAFEQAVFTIQNMSDDMEKLAAATDIFGSRAANLMPVFQMTSAEATKMMQTYRLLGGTMSDELVNAGSDLSDMILWLKVSWQGLMNTLATEIIPILTKIIRVFALIIAYINSFIKAIRGITGSFSKNSSAVKGSGKMASNLSSGASAAKELKRQLASFDELNILSDSSSSGSSGIDTSDYSSGVGGEGLSLFSDEQMQRLQDFQDFLNSPIMQAIFKGVRFAVNIIFNPIGTFVTTVGKLYSLWVDNTDAGKWVDENITQPLKQGFEEGTEDIKNDIPNWPTYFEEAWADIKKQCEDGWALFKKDSSESLANADDKAKNFADNFNQGIENFKTNWSEAWSNMKEDFNKKFGKFFTKEYWTTKWTSVTEGTKSGIKNVANAIITRIENMWNNIAKKFNDSGVISGINKVLGTEIKLPTISIPRLAKGGIITTPTIAQLGEYSGARSNPEIAAPQSLLESIIQANNSDIISALYSLGDRVVNSVDNKDTNVYLDSTRVSREVTKQQKTLNNLNGSSLVNAF